MIGYIYSMIKNFIIKNNFYYKIARVTYKQGYVFLLQVNRKNIFHKFSLEHILKSNMIDLLHPVDIIIVGLIIYCNNKVKVSLDFELLEPLRNKASHIVNDLNATEIMLDLSSSSFIITTGHSRLHLSYNELLNHYLLLSLLPNSERLNLGIMLGNKFQYGY